VPADGHQLEYGRLLLAVRVHHAQLVDPLGARHGAKLHRLLLHALHQVRARDAALGEARIVLDLGRRHQLPARNRRLAVQFAFKHHRRQIRARQIQRRRPTGGTRTDHCNFATNTHR
jgi:hypothetical protein